MVSKNFFFYTRISSLVLTFFLWNLSHALNIAQTRIKNTITPAQDADHSYWIRIGNNSDDEENWIKAGPKYLIETLPKIQFLLECINNKLEELVKNGKITIINIDGTNIQHLIHTLKDQQTTSQLLNVNCHQGNITIDNQAHLDISPPASSSLALYKQFLLKNSMLFKSFLTHYYTAFRTFCYQKPWITTSSAVALAATIVGIGYLTYKKYNKKRILIPSSLILNSLPDSMNK